MTALDSTEAPDWELISDPSVAEVIEQVTRKLAREAEFVSTADDLQQDALILIATNGARIRGYLADGRPSHVSRWLNSRLRDSLRTPQRRAGLNESLEAAQEAREQGDDW